LKKNIKNFKNFVFFGNVKITKGINRSIAINLYTSEVHLISNSILSLFDDNFCLKIDNLNGFDNKTVFEWLFFFQKNNLGIFDNSNLFHEKCNIEFLIPYQINDLVIQVTFKNLINIKSQIIVNSLTLIIDDYDIKIYELLKKNSKFLIYKSLDIFINYELNELFKGRIESTFKNVNRFVFYNFKQSILDKTIRKSNNCYYIKESNLFKNCGFVKIQNFNSNSDFIFQSINYNSCLYKKVSIDKDGNIKNCPSMPQSFGNIKDTSLEEALNHPDLKKYWNVNKDMIQVCKDCEFRHICTDCRAYTEQSHFDGEIDLSKPLKCGYNPYTNEWAEWSTNPLKQKAIEFYGMQDLVKKND